MTMRYIALFCLILSYANPATAQDKLEREFRIHPDVVPERAKSFAAAITGNSTLKWYREEGLEQVSLEAKAKVKGQRFSIEFDTSGQIQDVEVEIQLLEIPEHTRRTMITALKEDFAKFKWEKIQRQYQGTEAVLLNFFAQKIDSTSPHTYYEVVIRGKKKGLANFYEWVFSESGAVLSKATLISRIADNLEY
jgi:hypothetical protein